MPKRIAITIAVSLGTYEAGVTYELLEAIRWHNSKAVEDDRIYIDVITGASAGGMTAAMLGQWLMFHGDAMHSWNANPLYCAWVQKISLKGLIKLFPGESKWASLCSSDRITQIGTEMLVDSMNQAGPQNRHESLEPGAPLRIGLAMTNLNGVDYQIPIVDNDDGGFNYTRSVDQQQFVIRPYTSGGLFLLDQEGDEHPISWDTLRDGAVACGAFPFAFRPQQIQRDKSEFVSEETPEGPAPAGAFGKTYVLPNGTDWSFAYTDGGILQNQPLGLAKSLVDAAISERLSFAQAALDKLSADASPDVRAADHAVGEIQRDADNRIYVFISPHSVKSAATTLKAAALGLSRILPQIVRVYLRQSAFHDWIMAEQTNRDLRLLDRRALELAGALERGDIKNVDAFLLSAENLDDLLLSIYASAQIRKGEADTRQAKLAAVDRLRHQYHDLYNHLAALDNGITLSNAFIYGIAALEAAAQLDTRDTMNIVAVLANGAKDLAGAGIFAFVGFFSERFRRHDYWIGRTKAQGYLERKDVCRLLGIHHDEMVTYLTEHVVHAPQPPLLLPLGFWPTLRAGAGWLVYGLIVLRWEFLLCAWLAGTLLIALGFLICHEHLFHIFF